MLWMGILVHPYTFMPVKVGGEFLKNWGRDEPEWCCYVMLRRQAPVDCILCPYWMYVKCFSTLICCEWAYGSTLTLLRLCRSGVDLAEASKSVSMYCHVQTTSWWDIKSCRIVPMHFGKMPLKYWGNVPSPWGPLMYYGSRHLVRGVHKNGGK